MDINLPGMNGVECVRRLKQLLPATQVMMLTAYEDTENIFNALAAGGPAFVDVTTASGCAWVASASEPWITITPPSSGTGSGRVTFTVAANTSGAARRGSLTVAGQQVTVSQQ